MGFRGDWKAFCQVFHFVRHYNTDEAVFAKNLRPYDMWGALRNSNACFFSGPKYIGQVDKTGISFLKKIPCRYAGSATHQRVRLTSAWFLQIFVTTLAGEPATFGVYHGV